MSFFFDVSDVDIYYHVINTFPQRASEFALDVPAQLDQLIADFLAKNPESRPASVGTMLEILGETPIRWSSADADA